jgi:hypothetical protein
MPSDENFGGFNDGSSSKTVAKQPKANADGLNGVGMKYALYTSTVKKDAVVSKARSITGGKVERDLESTSDGSGVFVSIRDGVTKGHIVNVRVNNSSSAAMAAVGSCCSCCSCCSGSASGFSGGGSGFGIETFSTKDIDFIRMDGNSAFESVGEDDRGCCGNCMFDCCPCMYWSFQTHCAACCKCCALKGKRVADDTSHMIKVHLRFKEGSTPVVVPIDFNEVNDYPKSDKEKCCEPWQIRKTTTTKEKLDDGTKVYTTNWTEDEHSPTCFCCSFCWDCEHNTCGVPLETKAFENKKKFFMDDMFKEHCEIKRDGKTVETETLVNILMHLMTEDRDK